MRLDDAECDTMLANWQLAYKVPGVVRWCGYTELGGSLSAGHRNGECRYFKVWSSDGVYPRSDIYLDEEHGQAPRFFQRCTLWHEFCHANAYNEDMESDEHNAHFREYRRRKPLYWIGDMVYKLIGVVWSVRDV